MAKPGRGRRSPSSSIFGSSSRSRSLSWSCSPSRSKSSSSSSSSSSRSRNPPPQRCRRAPLWFVPASCQRGICKLSSLALLALMFKHLIPKFVPMEERLLGKVNPLNDFSLLGFWPEHAETTGIMSVLFLVFGLAAGSIIAWIWVI
ncbi:hypothetical protein glysoja_030619 [Glycine soja]|uniref:Uncharacterized protein n=1 Tax=Glycine soja TaxID=3848 RepID=A0A0B2R0W0_GLYSO|nr:hypothetical protein glysoja_030619 [Glycine soja]